MLISFSIRTSEESKKKKKKIFGWFVFPDFSWKPLSGAFWRSGTLSRLNYFSHGISFPTLSFTQSGQIELNAPGGRVFIAMYWGGQIMDIQRIIGIIFSILSFFPFHISKVESFPGPDISSFSGDVRWWLWLWQLLGPTFRPGSSKWLTTSQKQW